MCVYARSHLHVFFAAIWALKRKVLGFSVSQKVNRVEHKCKNLKNQDTQSLTGTYSCITPLRLRAWQREAFVTCTTITVDWKTSHRLSLNRSSYFPRVSQVKSFYWTNATPEMCICVCPTVGSVCQKPKFFVSTFCVQVRWCFTFSPVKKMLGFTKTAEKL